MLDKLIISKYQGDLMKKQNITFALIGSFLILSIILAACSSGQQSGNQRGPPQNYSRNGFGNITPAQRQAIMEQRLKAYETACENKTAGDSCIIESPRGNITSTCKMPNNNGTLSCAPAFFGNSTNSTGRPN